MEARGSCQNSRNQLIFSVEAEPTPGRRQSGSLDRANPQPAIRPCSTTWEVIWVKVYRITCREIWLRSCWMNNLHVLNILNNLGRQVDLRTFSFLETCFRQRKKSSSRTTGSASFPQFPAEIRNYIWKITVEDYPARIVDLREHRLPAKCLTESSSSGLQTQEEIDDTREVAEFKSLAPAPTVLYICRDSSYIA
jgi:hypothetical protein